MDKLSVTVITFNEEHNIEACLQSVQWADEIIVVDSFSTDKTVSLAKKYTDKVFQCEWKGYVEQNNLALKFTTQKWVLRIDADERVTPELASEIKKVLRIPGELNGYRIPRKIFFLGRFLKRPEHHQIRLFKMNGALWKGGKVNERLEVKGKTGRLTYPILHYSHQNLSKTIDKLNIYTSLDNEGTHRFSILFHLAFDWIFTFFKEYLFYYRFLDGIPGLIFSQEKCFYVFTKYAKRWEKLQN